MDYEKLLVVLIDLYIADVDINEDEVLARWMIDLGSLSIASIHQFKERGNVLFKDGDFSGAAYHYKQAIKLVCFLGPVSKHDEVVCWNLAVSLILNSAACALKVHLDNEARSSCTLVLKFEPTNVKALYRRTMALVKLNLLKEAHNDLKAAIIHDPQNKDIVRELENLERRMIIDENGKRISTGLSTKDDLSIIGEDKRGKTVIDTPKSEFLGNSKIIDVKSEAMLNMDKMSPVKANIDEMVPSNPIGSREDVKTQDQKERIFEFTKNKGSSRLRIPESTYKKHCGGNEVTFYNTCSSSFMKVRTREPIQTAQVKKHKVVLRTVQRSFERREFSEISSKRVENMLVTGDICENQLDYPHLDNFVRLEADNTQDDMDASVSLSGTLTTISSESGYVTPCRFESSKPNQRRIFKRLSSKKGTQQ